MPSFDPLSLNVDWIALPSGLMYDILNIPNQIEALKRRVSSASEYDYDPPEFAEFYWVRQRGSAILGLEISKVATRLRKFANLPAAREIEGELSTIQLLQKRKATIEKAQAAHQTRLGNMPASFIPPNNL